MLIKYLQESEWPVVEVWAWFFSTPIMHWLCKSMWRKLITYENDPYFYEMAKRFTSPGHKIKFINSWDDMDFKTHYWLVFIDHHPDERRVVDILNFKDSADYIVVHDTEKVEKYWFDKAFKAFKYFYTWKECKPWTSVLSNFKKL